MTPYLDEDAIASKWYGKDQWLLTFYPNGPNGHGKLIFTIVLQDGTYETVEYHIPSEDYLGKWVHVAASYDIIDESPLQVYGLLRLYWSTSLVATRRVDSPWLALRASNRPIHVGDAGIGTVWSRFQGDIDELKIWQ